MENDMPRNEKQIQSIIFALASPEYFGSKEEKERVVEMLKSTDPELVRLGTTIIYERVKNRHNVEEDK